MSPACWLNGSRWSGPCSSRSVVLIPDLHTQLPPQQCGAFVTGTKPCGRGSRLREHWTLAMVLRPSSTGRSL